MMRGLQCSAARSQGAAGSSAGFTGSPKRRRSLCLGSGGLRWAARIGGERASYKQGSVFSAVRSYLPLLKPEAPSHPSEAVCLPL